MNCASRLGTTSSALHRTQLIFVKGANSVTSIFWLQALQLILSRSFFSAEVLSIGGNHTIVIPLLQQPPMKLRKANGCRMIAVNRGKMTFAGHGTTRMATDWRLRLNYCQSKLQGGQHDRQAWRWKIQIRVLSFFLSRYGDVPTVEWLPTESSPPISRWPRHPVVAQPPIPIRRCLQRIAAANAGCDRN